MLQNSLSARGFTLGVTSEAGRGQFGFLVWRNDQMIHPLEEIRAGLVAHPPGQLAGEAVPFKKPLDPVAEQVFGRESQRPVEALWRGGSQSAFAQLIHDKYAVGLLC